MRRAVGGCLSHWLLALGFLACPSSGQEPEAPAAGPAAAAVLRKARETGALSRVLGSRWFEDEADSVVHVKGEALEGGALRFSIEFLPVAAMREERTRLACEVGPDGAVRAVESEMVRGAERVRVSGEVKEGKLTLVADPGGERWESPWPAEALPLPILVFVLPALCDQELPPRLAVRVFHGFDRRVEESRGSLRWAREGEAWRVEMRDLAPGQPGSRVVAEPGTGALREVVIGGMRMKPITPEDGQSKAGKRAE